jgi:hypothetical protein
MKRAILLFAGMLLLFAPSAFGRVPDLNIKAICTARSADAKLLRSTPEESVGDCVLGEESQKQNLTPVWASTSVSIRNLCQSDGRALGTTSYLDLLSCIEMIEDLEAFRKKTPAKQ